MFCIVIQFLLLGSYYEHFLTEEENWNLIVVWKDQRGVEYHSGKPILIKMTSQPLSDNTHFRTQAFICLLSLELVPFIHVQISLLQINASVDL